LYHHQQKQQNRLRHHRHKRIYINYRNMKRVQIRYILFLVRKEPTHTHTHTHTTFNFRDTGNIYIEYFYDFWNRI
jgi:hypothetical protein